MEKQRHFNNHKDQTAEGIGLVSSNLWVGTGKDGPFTTKNKSTSMPLKCGVTEGY